MAYSLFYFDEVEVDIIDAKLWYRSKSEKIERNFVDVVQKTFLKILEHPKAYSIRYRKIRIAHPPIFPYSIHFYIDDIKRKIVIIAIIHGKRNQNIVKKRFD